jgi:hypothetical protein
VWQSVVNGQKLTFHLAGINNQNFIMRDDETGSWWQQITGKAIQGPLKGQTLASVSYDELSFAEWKHENPNGRVLRPDPKVLADQKYETADWEAQVGRMPVRISRKLDDTFEPRTLVIGLTVGDAAKAYPLTALEKQNPIIDSLGGKDVLLVLANDKSSVRAFYRTVDDRTLEFFAEPNSSDLIDAETGSRWNFEGHAVSGELAGKQLEKINALKDYWFDWKNYHAETMLYSLGPQ